MGVSSRAALVSTASLGVGKAGGGWGGRLGTLLGPEGTSIPLWWGDPLWQDCGWAATTSNGFSWVVGPVVVRGGYGG
jgi:hypothetical protein